MTDPDLHGVIPIVPTPFAADGGLDLEGLARIVDYLVDAGVNGMAVLGMASETYALTEPERERVISTAAERLDGRLPLVAGCSHNSGQAVAQLAVAAHKAGANALMMMPPAMGDPATDVIRGYYTDAAEATDLPIMIQDNPSWTGVQLPLSLYDDLSRLDTVRYAKIETRHPPTTMAAVRNVVGDRLGILGGQAGSWLPEELARGSLGTMPAAIMPQIYLRVLSLWTTGQEAEARAVFDRFYPLIRVTGTPGVGIPMSKVIFNRLGLIDSAVVRAPLSPLRDQDVADLEAVCRALDVYTIMRSRDAAGAARNGG